MVDLFIGFTRWANARFDFFHEPESKAFLLFPCAFTDGTFKTLLGSFAVLISNSLVLHNRLLSKTIPTERIYRLQMLFYDVDVFLFAHIL